MNVKSAILIFVFIVLMPAKGMANELREIVLHSDSDMSISLSEIKGYIAIDMGKATNEVYHLNVDKIKYLHQFKNYPSREKKIIIVFDDLKVIIFIYKKGIDENEIIDLINKANNK